MAVIKRFYLDNKSDIFIVLSILLVNIWTLSPILTSYYCGDDLYNFQVVGHVPAFNSSVANVIINDFRDWFYGQGRFFPFAFYALYVFWLFDNVYLYKIFLVVITLTAVGLFSRLVYILSNNKNLAFIVMLITPIMFQFKNYHDPFLSFHGLMQVVFIYCLLSLIMLSRYIQTEKKPFLFFSVLFFIFSLLTYEIAFTFIVFIAVVLFLHSNKSLINKIKLFSLFVIPEITLFAFVVYLKKNATAPVCGYVPNFDLVTIAITYFNQTVSAFPLTYVIKNNTFNMLGFFKFYDVIFAIAIVLCLAYLSYKKNIFKSFDFVRNKLLIFLAFAIILLPGLPISLSPKYQSEITFGKAYLPILIEYFGVSLLFSMAVYYARCKLKLVVVLCIAVISVVHLLNNKSIAEIMTAHWKNRNDLLAVILKSNTNVVPDSYTICFEEAMPTHGREFLYMNTNRKYNIATIDKCPKNNSYNLIYYANGDLAFAKLVNNETNDTKYTFAKKQNSIWHVESLSSLFIQFITTYSGNYAWENNFAWVEKQLNIDFNTKMTEQNFTISFDLTSLDNRQVEIFAGDKLLKTVDLEANKFTNIDLNISSKFNVITIKSNKNPISPNNGDPRLISFGITKIKIKETNK